jgi:hypothetical protein
MPLFDPSESIPGYRDAVEQEQFLWDAAFLGLPEKICGFEVKPLTARHLLWLYTIRSPFVTGQRMTDLDVHLHAAAFMRLVAPDFSPKHRWRRRLFFWRYRHSFARQRVDVAVTAIRDYLGEAFAESPGGKGGEAYYSVAASVIHFICGNYSGVSFEATLDLPLKIVFQLMKCKRRETGAIMFKSTDALKSRWLEKVNGTPAPWSNGGNSTGPASGPARPSHGKQDAVLEAGAPIGAPNPLN